MICYESAPQEAMRRSRIGMGKKQRCEFRRNPVGIQEHKLQHSLVPIKEAGLLCPPLPYSTATGYGGGELANSQALRSLCMDVRMLAPVPTSKSQVPVISSKAWRRGEMGVQNWEKGCTNSDHYTSTNGVLLRSLLHPGWPKVIQLSPKTQHNPSTLLLN